MTDPHAPGDLEVVRRFINTLDIEGGTDAIASPEALTQWLTEQGLLAEPAVARAPRDVALAKDLREGLRALAVANHGGSPPALAEIEQLNVIAQSLPLAVRLGSDGEARLEPQTDGVAGALGRILAVVYRATADGSWSRLKACQSNACQWAFYDYSKNRSGAWCSMAVCGNRAKVRRYQQRRAAERKPGKGPE